MISQTGARRPLPLRRRNESILAPSWCRPSWVRLSECYATGFQHREGQGSTHGDCADLSATGLAPWLAGTATVRPAGNGTGLGAVPGSASLGSPAAYLGAHPS